jgi:hypothetical protein
MALEHRFCGRAQHGTAQHSKAQQGKAHMCDSETCSTTIHAQDSMAQHNTWR